MTREAEIEGYRRRWLTGDFRAVIDAFEHFQNWDEPLPDWLAGPVWAALHIAFEKGGAPGKGKTGSFKTRAARSDKHWSRWLIASTFLHDRPAGMTRADAWKAASKLLAATPNQGSAGAIEASYNKIERLRKSR